MQREDRSSKVKQPQMFKKWSFDYINKNTFSKSNVRGTKNTNVKSNWKKK